MDLTELSVNTILFDLAMDPKDLQTESQLSKCSSNLESILRKYFVNFEPLNSLFLEDSIFKLYSSGSGCMTNVRVYKNGQITVNIEYFLDENPKLMFGCDNLGKLEQEIQYNVPGIIYSNAFTPVSRKSYCTCYRSEGSKRLREYVDVDNVLFEKRSPYQKVQIVHSKIYGNMLFLNGLVNITESDLLYTESLMARGKEEYKNKEILILGGGDGALLYELLKEKPKHVTMVEIDEVVMEACDRHMRSICGDVLEKRSAPNYEIIVGDCINYLEQIATSGKKFDYVFGDLTDLPIINPKTNKVQNFTSKMLSLSFKVLQEKGKFMTHSTSWEVVVKMLETEFAKLNPPVIVNTSTVFIPSFNENWLFYQVRFDNIA